MAEEQTRAIIKDSAALEELARGEEAQQQAARVSNEIRHLLDPLKGQLRALVLEHERLHAEALAARQEFFRLARTADPSLKTHSGLHYEREGGQVYVVWDDAGPRYSVQKGAELPPSHDTEHRKPGQRAIDLLHWL